MLSKSNAFGRGSAIPPPLPWSNKSHPPPLLSLLLLLFLFLFMFLFLFLFLFLLRLLRKVLRLGLSLLLFGPWGSSLM